jgi:hypothetical protein
MMTSRGRATAAIVLMIALGACGGRDDTQAASEPGPTVTERATATVTATVTTTVTDTPTPKPKPTPKPTPTQSLLFPVGFPQKVSISSLPDEVRNWYQMSGQSEFAVAVAPGVWSELPPGASVMDAATAGVLDGFCASIDAYERQHTPGEEHGGTCW